MPQETQRRSDMSEYYCFLNDYFFVIRHKKGAEGYVIVTDL